MQVYAVFGLREPALVRANIKKSYDQSHYEAGNGVFFIASSSETTQQVASKLGFGDASGVQQTSGIVVSVANYWGRHNPDLWEWIRIKQAENGG
ncbi:MAG: hypothetical protein OXH59_03085 [Rhodospirillaceae bacterium]|nr:hypothetical protein [Rhodospirillaceae bacterium]